MKPLVVDEQRTLAKSFPTYATSVALLPKGDSLEPHEHRVLVTRLLAIFQRLGFTWL